MTTLKDNLARLTLTWRAQGCGSRSDRALAESLRCPRDWQGTHANARPRLARGEPLPPAGRPGTYQADTVHLHRFTGGGSRGGRESVHT